MATKKTNKPTKATTKCSTKAFDLIVEATKELEEEAQKLALSKAKIILLKQARWSAAVEKTHTRLDDLIEATKVSPAAVRAVDTTFDLGPKVTGQYED